MRIIEIDGLDVPVKDEGGVYVWQDEYKVDVPEGRHGDVEVRRFTIDALTSFRASMNTWLTGERGALPPGEYTGLFRGGKLWMSDTPDEVTDQMRVVRMAELLGGRLLVNGLGLGMFVKAALAFPGVEHIDVVEIDPDVVALVGPHYAQDPRVTIHLADAYTIRWPKGTPNWTVVWSDIWPTINDLNLPNMKRLRRKYQGKCSYHEQWSYPEARAMRRMYLKAVRAGYVPSEEVLEAHRADVN